MNKEKGKLFFTNIVFLLFVNALVKPFYLFGIDRVVQNRVGTENFGELVIILNFVYLFQIFNDFGLQNYNSRLIASNPEKLKSIFPNTLSLKIIMSSFFILITFFIGYFTPIIINKHLLFFIILNQFIASFVIYLRTNISGSGYYKTDSIISIIDKVMMIIIMGIILYTPLFDNELKLEWFVYAQGFSFFVAMIISFAVIEKKLIHISFELPDLKFVKKLFVQSIPYALIILLMTIYTRIDIEMIKWLLPNGEYEAGLYHAGFRQLEFLHVVGLLFASLLLPLFASSNNRKDINNLILISSTLLFTFAIPVSFCSWYFGEDIMNLLYHSATPEWGITFGYIILSYIGVAGMYIFATLHTAKGNTKFLNTIFAIAVIINIALNYILIPKMKTEGAAIATLITQTFVWISNMIYAHKIYNISSIFYKLLTLFGLSLIYIPLFYYSEKLSTMLITSNLVLFLVFVFIFPILSIAFGIIKFSWIKELLKK